MVGGVIRPLHSAVLESSPYLESRTSLVSPRHLSCNYNKVATMSLIVNENDLQAKGKYNLTVWKSRIMDIERYLLLAHCCLPLLIC